MKAIKVKIENASRLQQLKKEMELMIANQESLIEELKTLVTDVTVELDYNLSLKDIHSDLMSYQVEIAVSEEQQKKATVKSKLSKKTQSFYDNVFEGLNWREKTNKYLTMNRVSQDETKIVVKVAESNIVPTKFGYALILDQNHVVFLKQWQVNNNFYGTEVVLDKNYFEVSLFGSFLDFEKNQVEQYNFNFWLEIAELQSLSVDENGELNNFVQWQK